MLVGPTLAYPPPSGSRCSRPPDHAGVQDDAGVPDDGAPQQDASGGGHGSGCTVAAGAPTTGLALVVALVLGVRASRRRHT